MIEVILTAEGHAEAVERPQPSAHGDIVTVRVDVAPMCTEFRARGDGIEHDDLGHEAAGVVVDAGGSTRVRAGDRVVVMPQLGCGKCAYCVQGDHIYCLTPRDVRAETGSTTGIATYAQYVLKPDYLLLPVPDDVSLEHAAAACCLLGPGLHATSRMNVGVLDTVLVSGAGPVGLGAIINAGFRGARVLVLEANPYRQELARRLGAEVFDPFSADTDNAIAAAAPGGITAAIETSGVASVPARLAGLVRRLGQLAIVAWGTDVVLPPLVPTGLSVHGCWHWNHVRLADQMWATIRGSREALDLVTTHHLDLTEADAAMDVQQSGQCGKVFLHPHGRSGE
ncbi:zinc-binding dehydrogenase [Promicromonospora sp. Populi]|uniref:zinc-dependent alcohol dehydrogenase n=1 Tax=Promicromonospora sp. Populi TaxID=3239420 RepID=UPI0034E2E417